MNTSTVPEERELQRLWALCDLKEPDNIMNTLPAPKEREIEQEILRALKGIRYGSVEIVIHDSQVVQIERKEKVRLDKPPAVR